MRTVNPEQASSTTPVKCMNWEKKAYSYLMIKRMINLALTKDYNKGYSK